MAVNQEAVIFQFRQPIKSLHSWICSSKATTLLGNIWFVPLGAALATIIVPETWWNLAYGIVFLQCLTVAFFFLALPSVHLSAMPWPRNSSASSQTWQTGCISGVLVSSAVLSFRWNIHLLSVYSHLRRSLPKLARTDLPRSVNPLLSALVADSPITIMISQFFCLKQPRPAYFPIWLRCFFPGDRWL